MGSVYQAEDQKLGRGVAIKFLRMAKQPGLLARFDREARVLASLNHPHIATLFGFEEEGGQPFLVMELVPGKSLSALLSRGAVPLPEALAIARQIAEAIEAAHGQRIVHRDLKPGNVMLTPDGRVKVLDFGLARDESKVDRASGDAVTREGMFVGTPSYASPEQARGEIVNAQTDIWAFGCVLFELLSGQLSFPGKSSADRLAAVLTLDPDWSKLPDGTPPRIRELLRRCLRKDPHRRLHDIADARIEIEDVITGAEGPSGPQRPPSRRGFLYGTLAASLLGASGFAAGRWLGRGKIPDTAATTEVVPPTTVGLDSWETPELILSGIGSEEFPAITPDGKWLAYVHPAGSQGQVGRMNLKTGEWGPATTAEGRGYAAQPCWSTDGNRVYFSRIDEGPGGIYSVSTFGSDERLELTNANNPQCLADGTILAGRIDKRDNLHRIIRWSPANGTSRVYPPVLALRSLEVTSLVPFPDGKEVAFWLQAAGDETETKPVLASMDLQTEEVRILNSADGIRDQLVPGRDNENVYVIQRTPGGTKLVAIPRQGGDPQIMLTSVESMAGGCFGPDGSFYFGLRHRAAELLRIPSQGGKPEMIAPGGTHVLGLPDGRILSTITTAGQSRVMVYDSPRPNDGHKLPTPFVQILEPTRLPGIVAGAQVILFAGETGKITPVAVDVRTGQIEHRWQNVTLSAAPYTICASSDGRTIYYAAGDNILAADRGNNPPRVVCRGGAAALTADGLTLVVARPGNPMHELCRVPVSGGKEEWIPIDRKLRLNVSSPIQGAATQGPADRVPVLMLGNESYFNIITLLNPATGSITRVPLDYRGDVFYPIWAGQDTLLAIGTPLRSKIWRCRRVKKG